MYASGPLNCHQKSASKKGSLPIQDIEFDINEMLDSVDFKDEVLLKDATSQNIFARSSLHTKLENENDYQHLALSGPPIKLSSQNTP